jgi:hypothetical protein
VVDDAEADAAATGLGAELSNDDARGHDGEQKWHLDDIRWRSHRAPTRGWTSLQEARPHCFFDQDTPGYIGHGCDTGGPTQVQEVIKARLGEKNKSCLAQTLTKLRFFGTL